MINNSIKAAFERMWQHTAVSLSEKAEAKDLIAHINNKENPHEVKWEQLPDKPFGEEMEMFNTLEWDGTNSSITVEAEGFGGAWHHVCDSTPQLEEWIDSLLTVNGDDGVMEFLIPSNPVENGVVFDYGTLLGFVEGMLIVAFEDNAEMEGFIFPKKGIYILKVGDRVAVSKIVATTPIFETVSVKTLDPKYLPYHVHELNGYIEKDGEILPEITLETNEDGLGFITKPLQLIADGSYTVVWNGVEYITKCIEITIGEATGQFLGNVGAIMGGDDSGEPFVIILAESEGQAVASLDGSTSITLSIKGEKVVKMDGRLLPEGLGYIIPEEAIYLETTIELTEEDGLYGAQFSGAIPFVLGEKYIVNWNGVEYETECQSTSINDGAVIGLGVGNPGLNGGEDNGLPFAIGSSSDYDMNLILTSEELTSTTFSIKKAESVKKIDEKLLPNSLSGNIEWEQIENKPFYEGISNTLEWDGTDGDIVVDLGGGMTLHHVCDSTPTISELMGATVHILYNGEMQTVNLTENNTVDMGDFYMVADCIGIALKDNVQVNVDPFNLILPKKGIYFGKSGGMYPTKIVATTEIFDVVKKINPKFLPKIPLEKLPEQLQFGEVIDKVDTLTLDKASVETIVPIPEEVMSQVMPGVTASYYHVSSTVPEEEDLIGGKLTLFGGGENTFPLLEELFGSDEDAYTYTVDNIPWILVVKNDNTVINSFGTDVTFPKKGIYFFEANDGTATVSAGTVVAPSKVFEVERLKPIDYKYLPESLQFGDMTKVILPEFIYPVISEYGMKLLYITSPANSDIMIGETYTIIWNDNIYENVATSYGDSYVLEGTDDAPFERIIFGTTPLGVEGGISMYGLVLIGNSNVTESVKLSIIQENFKTLDPIFLPAHTHTVDEIEGLNNVDGAQSDWNQNDETAEDYVKNRPFYSELVDGINYTWDGVVGDTPVYNITYQDREYSLIKVSDFTLMENDTRVISGVMATNNSLSQEFEVPFSSFEQKNGYLYYMEAFPSGGEVVVSVIFIVTTPDGASFLELPSTGVYVNYVKYNNDDASANYYFEQIDVPSGEHLVKIDTKYLPKLEDEMLSQGLINITAIPSEKYPLNSLKEFINLPNGYYDLNTTIDIQAFVGEDENYNPIYRPFSISGLIYKYDVFITNYTHSTSFEFIEVIDGELYSGGVISLDGFGYAEAERILGLEEWLETEAQTVIGAINELNANKADAFYVDLKVAELVDSSPDTLNTLNELAAALNDDPNFATTVATQIGNKVDKVEGKGLSTNDYTTKEKEKLTGIEAGANKTIVDSALSASSENPVQNKVVKEAIDNIKITVDSALSASSENPVQNKVVKEAIDNITVESINAAPAYTYSTEDLIPGTSTLETGKLYFVYE